MNRLILVRHGESQWNLENRFTGWEDIPLTANGKDEAKKAGELLQKNKLSFKRAYTSYLKRAVHTLWIILSECDQSWIPVTKNWRLNERHYGHLQGLNKNEVKKKYGENQFLSWRRGYDVSPPLILEGQDRLSGDCRYKNIQIPKGESLKQTLERVIPYWNDIILNQIKKDSLSDKTSINTLIVAHGNSLRALIKYLTDMDEEKIMEFEFVTGIPLICELDNNYKIKKMDWMSHAH